MSFFNFVHGVRRGIIKLNYFFTRNVTRICYRKGNGYFAILGDKIGHFILNIAILERRVRKSVTERITNVIFVPFIFNCARFIIFLVSAGFVIFITYVNALFVDNFSANGFAACVRKRITRGGFNTRKRRGLMIGVVIFNSLFVGTEVLYGGNSVEIFNIHINRSARGVNFAVENTAKSRKAR